MRILHTSDWHLGQRFISQSREAEQQMALDWLLEVIAAEKVDVLLVSGDIFDVGNPPLVAEEMYYRFLTRLRETCCRHAVITAGNHDSPSRIDAPRGLLRALQVHAVGAAGAADDHIIRIPDETGATALIVAAVPFLRERDFRVTTVGETPEERIRRIQEGIAAHYQHIAEVVEHEQVPVVAMGHLFAKEAIAHEEQQNIYLGNLENIAAEDFPKRFNYVALGHIHRMQPVGKMRHIRYSGALIPLSFSEIADTKGVLVLDTAGPFDPFDVRVVKAPVFRQLLTLHGALPEVEEALKAAHHPEHPLPAWVEVVLTGDTGIAMPDRHLRELATGLHLEILKVKVERTASVLSEQAMVDDLASLTVEEVFLQRCQSKGINEEETQLLRQDFQELKTWMNDQDIHL